MGRRFSKTHQWDEPNTDPGLVQTISPSLQWKHSVFNGLSQLIVQSTKQPGAIEIKVSAKGLQQAIIKIQTEPATLRPSVPAE
jgi:beta-galactosidase